MIMMPPYKWEKCKWNSPLSTGLVRLDPFYCYMAVVMSSEPLSSPWQMKTILWFCTYKFFLPSYFFFYNCFYVPFYTPEEASCPGLLNQCYNHGYIFELQDLFSEVKVEICSSIKYALLFIGFYYCLHFSKSYHG